MSATLILEYTRSTGEIVSFTYFPGRVLGVYIDGECVHDIPVNQREGESIQRCAMRLAREWQATDKTPSPQKAV